MKSEKWLGWLIIFYLFFFLIRYLLVRLEFIGLYSGVGLFVSIAYHSLLLLIILLVVKNVQGKGINHVFELLYVPIKFVLLFGIFGFLLVFWTILNSVGSVFHISNLFKIFALALSIVIFVFVWIIVEMAKKKKLETAGTGEQIFKSR